MCKLEKEKLLYWLKDKNQKLKNTPKHFKENEESNIYLNAAIKTIDEIILQIESNKFDITNNDNNKIIDENKKVENYIEDIDKLSKKYGLSISHEDWHGSFEIEKYDEENIKWLRNANILDIN